MCGRTAVTFAAPALQARAGARHFRNGGATGVLRTSYNAGPNTRLPVLYRRSTDGAHGGGETEASSTKKSDLDSSKPEAKTEQGTTASVKKEGLDESVVLDGDDAGIDNRNYEFEDVKAEVKDEDDDKGVKEELGAKPEDIAPGDRVLMPMKWGLVPSFTKEGAEKTGYNMINARSEGIESSPVFRRLLKNKRCVVYLDGFYEWTTEKNKKQGYFVHAPDKEPLAVAALFDVWNPKHEKGSGMYSVTLLTTSSSQALGWLHDRMPVILGDNESIERWVNCDDYTIADCRHLLRPYKGPLEWYAVAPLVNSIRNNTPECLQSLAAFEKHKRDTGIMSMFKPKAKKEEAKPEPKAEPVEIRDDGDTTDATAAEKPLEAKPSPKAAAAPLTKSPQADKRTKRKEPPTAAVSPAKGQKSIGEFFKK